MQVKLMSANPFKYKLPADATFTDSVTTSVIVTADVGDIIIVKGITPVVSNNIATLTEFKTFIRDANGTEAINLLTTVELKIDANDALVNLDFAIQRSIITTLNLADVNPLADTSKLLYFSSVGTVSPNKLEDFGFSKLTIIDSTNNGYMLNLEELGEYSSTTLDLSKTTEIQQISARSLPLDKFDILHGRENKIEPLVYQAEYTDPIAGQTFEAEVSRPKVPMTFRDTGDVPTSAYDVNQTFEAELARPKVPMTFRDIDASPTSVYDPTQTFEMELSAPVVKDPEIFGPDITGRESMILYSEVLNAPTDDTVRPYAFMGDEVSAAGSALSVSPSGDMFTVQISTDPLDFAYTSIADYPAAGDGNPFDGYAADSDLIAISETCSASANDTRIEIGTDSLLFKNVYTNAGNPEDFVGTPAQWAQGNCQFTLNGNLTNVDVVLSKADGNGDLKLSGKYNWTDSGHSSTAEVVITDSYLTDYNASTAKLNKDIILFYKGGQGLRAYSVSSLLSGAPRYFTINLFDQTPEASSKVIYIMSSASNTFTTTFQVNHVDICPTLEPTFNVDGITRFYNGFLVNVIDGNTRTLRYLELKQAC